MSTFSPPSANPPVFVASLPPSRLRYVASVVFVAFVGSWVVRAGEVAVGRPQRPEVPLDVVGQPWAVLDVVAPWIWAAVVLGFLVWLVSPRAAPAWSAVVGGMLALVDDRGSGWLVGTALVGFLAYEIVWKDVAARPSPWGRRPRLTALVCCLAATVALLAMGLTASQHPIEVQSLGAPTRDAVLIAVRNVGDGPLRITGAGEPWGPDPAGLQARVRSDGRLRTVARPWPITVQPGREVELYLTIGRRACPASATFSRLPIRFEHDGAREVVATLPLAATLNC